VAIFRSDHTRSTLPGGSTSQQFTNVDFREKADPSLSRSYKRSEIVYNGINVTVFADPITVTTSVLGDCVLGIIIAGGYTGYWPYGYWPEGYWPDDYWHDPSSTVTISTTIPVAVSIWGDFVPGIVLGEPITVTLTQIGLFKHPAAPRDPALDQEFDCRGQDRFGNWDQGIPVFTVSLEGTWLNKTIFADPITVSVSQSGSWVTAILVTADPITVTIGFVPVAVFSPVIILERAKTNWFKWSDIGSLDFTIDKTNVAGERPLDWKGWVYSIRKLGGKVVAYGENGVSVLTPAQKYYGLQTIYRVGLKGKGAVSGDDSVHYFVDNLGQLWRFSEGLEKLDYSEYLSGMLENLVLSWDTANKLLYICDGSQGYIFSQDSGSLGAGPVNVTGIDSQGGILYVAAPATIATPTLELCTDIYDFGSRRGKNIYSLEFGTDLTETLKAAGY